LSTPLSCNALVKEAIIRCISLVVKQPQPLEAPLLIELERREKRLPLLKKLQQGVERLLLPKTDLGRGREEGRREVYTARSCRYREVEK